MSEHLKTSITKGTLNGYISKRKDWLQYLTEKEGVNKWGVNLERIPLHDDKVLRVTHFAVWMSKTLKRNSETIRQTLAALHTCMEIAGLETYWFNDGRLKRARHSGRLTIEEFNSQRLSEISETSSVQKNNGTKYPLTLDMVIESRRLFWDNRGWSTKDLDSKVLYLSITIGWDSGLRPGQITKAEKDQENHCLWFGGVQFVMFEGRAMSGGEQFRNFILENPSNIKKVEYMDFLFNTHKTSTVNKSLAAKIKTIGRRNKLEEQLLEDAINWWVHARTNGSDEIFTRKCVRTGRAKRFIRKNLGAGIKTTAKCVGLEPIDFACKSMRNGFASHCKSIGVSKEESNERGTWTKTSRVPDRHYQFEIGSKGALAMESNRNVGSAGNPGGLNVSMLKRMKKLGRQPL